jgi:diacylglycerol O-acyltransferase
VARSSTFLVAAFIEAFTPVPQAPLRASSSVARHVDNDYQWLLDQFRSTSPAAITRAVAEITRFDSTPWVGDIDVPTSVLITLRDRVFSARRQRWLADQIADAHTVTVDAGHARCTLQADRFRRGLRDAVDSVHRRVTDTVE